MKRIGVIGCGTVAEFGHLPAIRETPGLELAALYDPNPEQVRKQAERFGVAEAHTDQEKFFEAGLDAVVIASPPGVHLENVRAAARHGVHVLCEKPLAMDDVAAREVIETMKAADRMLAVGFVYRFSPVAMQIRQWVRDKVVGEIRSSRLIYLWDLHGQYERLPDGSWRESPRWRGRMLEGGPMVDCGVHQIDLSRWWLGSEIVKQEVAAAWVSDYEAPDHVYAHLDHENGAHTMVEMSFTYGHVSKDPAPVFTYELIGTGGVIRFDRNGWHLEARNGEATWTAPGASEKNFPGMHAAFAHALNTGDLGDLATGEDGLIATRIARSLTDLAIARRAREWDRETTGAKIG